MRWKCSEGCPISAVPGAGPGVQARIESPIGAPVAGEVRGAHEEFLAEEAIEGETEETRAGASAGEDEAMTASDAVESGEARPSKPARDPGAPTKAEYEGHMLTHTYGDHGASPDEDEVRATHSRAHAEEEGETAVALVFCLSPGSVPQHSVLSVRTQE